MLGVVMSAASMMAAAVLMLLVMLMQWLLRLPVHTDDEGKFRRRLAREGGRGERPHYRRGEVRRASRLLLRG